MRALERRDGPFTVWSNLARRRNISRIPNLNRQLPSAAGTIGEPVASTFINEVSCLRSDRVRSRRRRQPEHGQQDTEHDSSKVEQESGYPGHARRMKARQPVQVLIQYQTECKKIRRSHLPPTALEPGMARDQQHGSA